MSVQGVQPVETRSVPNVENIRRQLEAAAAARAEADTLHAKATADLKWALLRAWSTPGLSKVEAARLAGLSRSAAYEMVEAD
jgi:hypothetical protein